MASDKLKELSQDELRKRLYQTFKNRGVLDTLKTQLRNQLIRELRNPLLRGELSQPVAVESGSLFARASNSLVADHLHRCGYEYSLSVFYPESGLQQEKLFTTQDLLQLMKINPKSKLYKALTSDIQQENKRGFLMQILMELTDHHIRKEGHDVDTQTISIPPYKESLVDKLQQIDRQFAEIYPQHQRLESLEAKLTEYRKEMEERLGAEMSSKLQYFKDVEIAKIKLEEKENSRKELVALQRELEKRYQTKSEGLMSRERNAIERLQMHQEIEAKETYAQRQGLLKDIEMVRSRETELKKRIEAFEVAEKLQEEKNRSLEDALRCRELAVRNIEDTYDQKLKNELLKYQIELKEEYVKRSHKVTEDEKKNREEAMRLREEALVIDSRKEEIHQAISHTEEVQLELNSANAQVSVLTRQNQLLTENLKETRDYPQLKAEKLELQTQIKFLKQQLEESHRELQQLRDRLSYPAAEQIALQAELRRAENGRKLDQEEFKTQKELLENQLQNEADRCAELTTQLLNCEDTIRRLNVQVEDLKLQLHQTQLDKSSPHCLSPIRPTEHLPSAATTSSVPVAVVLTDHGLSTLSPHQPAAFSPASSDSSKPQKLLFEDLEESDDSLHNQEDIPEQAENDVLHTSGDIIDWSHITPTRPTTATSQQDSAVGPRQSEEQEQNEEEERTERDGNGGRGGAEHLDREQEELAVMEKEKMQLEEPQKTDEKLEEMKVDRSEFSIPSADPLEKYMQIILQSKEQDLADKSSRQEEVEEVSLLKSLSNERDDSIAAISLGEPEEDFW
ncbi:oral-facial-digital syndrome 1 protein isoform X4 [Rhinatrema bivittatum]|uniref:oral-facial-digital syndrome 1 protein isoform X4 n=1 Tax=Rhinatrema bivittatum TaxID=194408 RepID=UPI00112A4E6C|nr:oral-facial-digital syndrome 1 protein isoform X4 [Rhinatrema bivittatum]